jgi:hypothetical protein
MIQALYAHMNNKTIKKKDELLIFSLFSVLFAKKMRMITSKFLMHWTGSRTSTIFILSFKIT